MSVRSLRYNTIEQHFTKGITASTDRDALAFLEAAQIYNTNQQRAIVNLVRSLKRVGLWSKMKAIYPFVGGTASSHKWNLKDPRDVDAAFRLTFSGGWTHSANGADPNGTNGYADTYFSPSTSASLSSMHVSYYTRQDSNGVEVEIGAADHNGAIYTGHTVLEIRTSGVTYSRMFDNAYASASDSNSIGYYIMTRTSTTLMKLFKNLSSISSSTRTATALTARNLWLGALHEGVGPSVANYFTTKECAFATIGDGLTDTDATNLYNIVNLYQKRLGRAV